MRCRTCPCEGHMQCLGVRRQKHWRKIVWECTMCLFRLPREAANCACCPAPGGVLVEVGLPHSGS